MSIAVAANRPQLYLSPDGDDDDCDDDDDDDDGGDGNDYNDEYEQSISCK